jgi:hypothetical protein
MAMKKLLWTLVATLASAAAAVLARKVAERVWCAVAKERPPERPAWAKLLVGAPIKHFVS